MEKSVRQRLYDLIADDRSFLQRWRVALIVQFLFSFVVLFFDPIELYVVNIHDLVFSFFTLWKCLAVVAAVYCIVTSLILALLPGALYDFMISSCFAATICLYIQGTFLNTQFGTLNGDAVAWQNHKRQAFAEILIWFFIIISVFFIRYLKKSLWKKVVSWGSAFVIAIHVVALITLVLTTDFHEKAVSGYLSTDRMFELSAKKNVIVFVLDNFDNSFLDDVVTQDPDLFQQLEGFTYYPNYIATYGNTYPSIVYMLTGEKYYFDKEPTVYKEEAYTNGPLLNTLKDNNFDTRIFTEELSMCKTSSKVIANHVSGEREISYKGMLRGMLNLVMYRDSPIAMKALFWFYTSDINTWASANGMYTPYNISDSYFSSDLSQKGITLQGNQDCFRMYHLQGAHTPYVLNAQAQYVDSGTDRTQQIEGCFHILDQYFARMKVEDIYRDATIIVTADHGDIGLGECPILFVKPSGQYTGEMKTSEAPVMDSDLPATILKDIQLENKEAGTSIFDIAEDYPRERVKFEKLETLNPEFKTVKEYIIKGDARDTKNWVESGKTYEMKYSFYKND